MSEKFKSPRNIDFYEIGDWIFIASFIPCFIPLFLYLINVIPFSMGVLATIIPGAFGVFFCFGINFWEEPLKESTIKKICNDPLVDIDVKLEIAKELSYKKSSITRNKLIYINHNVKKSKK